MGKNYRIGTVAIKGGSHKAYGGGTDASSVVTDTNKVRPTLQLKNAKIIGGNGTKANPFIVK